MNTKQDEYLEALWYLQEQAKDSVANLAVTLDAPVDLDELTGLATLGMVSFNSDTGKVSLTQQGYEHARGLIRKHRLAERLLHDVLGFSTQRYESEACSFEHLVAPHVIEGICTLLGHPRECPHGLPIPEGPCCIRNQSVVHSAVEMLADLDVGQTGRVAYLNCHEDTQLHRLSGLQIHPGAEVRVHQKYPAWVIECDGGMIAIDDRTAQSICVWKTKAPAVDTRDPAPPPKTTSRWRFWKRRS